MERGKLPKDHMEKMYKTLVRDAEREVISGTEKEYAYRHVNKLTRILKNNTSLIEDRKFRRYILSL